MEVEWARHSLEWIPWRAMFILSLWCIYAYNRYFVDPVNQFPGPLIVKYSAWPNWYHAVVGDRHRWINELHTKYGPVVQLAPKIVSFNTIDARDLIYKSPKTNVTKADWYQCVQDSAGGFISTFTAREKAQHSAKRRLLSHAFSDKALRDYESRIIDCVRKWMGILETESMTEGGAIDMGSSITFLIFDILGELCFGKPLGLMSDPEQRVIAALVPDTTRDWYMLGHHPLTTSLRYILFKTRLGQYLGGKLLPNNARFRTYCLGKFQDRVKRGKSASDDDLNSRTDMFDALLSGRDTDEGQDHTMGDLACETVLLMVAGTQSTSCALSATVFYLVNNPALLARLEDEIRSAFASEDDIRYYGDQQLTSLPFLRACLQESMRLSPPTPGHLPREVGPEGLLVDGVHVPGGMDVGVCAYAMHRNQAYFQRPAEFDPGRWMDDEQTNNVHAFNAFSAGPTGCIGKNLAYMELFMTIALLVWHFDMSISSPAGNRAEYHMRDRFVGDGKGPVVHLLRRGTDLSGHSTMST